jgi:hypothetical protein
LARPPRTPSNVIETKEEQQMRLEKLGFGDKSKYEIIKGNPQSAATPHIY